MKIVFNILRGILALILCFLLFGTLIGGSVGSSVTAFVKEDVVATVFTSMDFNEMFENHIVLIMCNYTCFNL